MNTFIAGIFADVLKPPPNISNLPEIHQAPSAAHSAHFPIPDSIQLAAQNISGFK
jgi:hypothetical protein